MSQDSPFKYVFWGLAILVVVSMAGAMSMVGGHMFRCGFPVLCRPWPLFPLSFLFVVFIVVVGWAVHRDAVRRGHPDPWLWATVAAFVPYLIGLIIYLVVSRSGARAVCTDCGKVLRSDFKVCPHCGHARELLCDQCQKPLSSEWQVCPYCGKPAGKSGERGS
jgi:RNA polymerase subunit RPABC4/transcription elongation factor Spt4